MKGELTKFCKDFEITVPVSKQMTIFGRVSKNHMPLEFERFKHALPHLGIEMAAAKTRELKYRLKEIKGVLEYPDNKTPLPEAIECLINGIEQSASSRVGGKTISKKDLEKMLQGTGK